MSSSATARTGPDSSTSPPSKLHFYRVRDDLTRAYQPANDEERLLLTQMVRAWIRLERLHEAENDILDQHSLVDLFNNDPDRYKMLSRSIAEGERMWRTALQEFQRARRRRLGRNATTPSATRPHLRPVPDPCESIPAAQEFTLRSIAAPCGSVNSCLPLSETGDASSPALLEPPSTRLVPP